MDLMSLVSGGATGIIGSLATSVIGGYLKYKNSKKQRRSSNTRWIETRCGLNGFRIVCSFFKKKNPNFVLRCFQARIFIRSLFHVNQ